MDWIAPIDITDSRLPSAFDELSLWSSAFGWLLLRELPLRGGMTVLDVACGTGFPVLEIASRLGPHSRVVGVDCWEEALQRARFKAGFYQLDWVELYQGDAANLSFADSAFDLVVSNLGLNNFKEPIAVLKECARVLKPGGELLLTTNPQGHMREFYELFRAVLRDSRWRQHQAALTANEEHRTSVTRIHQWLCEAGFEPTRTVCDEMKLWYADSAALFRHPLTRVGFLAGWAAVIPEEERPPVFETLRNRIDEAARPHGLTTTIPVVLIAARKPAK
ncbi:MAG TPA: class I SAM-dependent methyltransferase [Terriglobales bacterium]|nr:class I SAM-dependent methyltransferase [Terriglobales bacterium]